MIRPVLYVFSKTEEMKNSISRYIRYIGINCEGLKHEFDPQTHAKTYSFFEEITSFLDSKSSETLLNTVVIIDVSDVDNDISFSLNPISDSDSTGQIVSSLILAYPEIYWVILGTSFNKSQPQYDLDSEWAGEHFVDAININHVIELLKRHQNGYRPLFDPSGLRTWIKNKVIETEQKENEKVPGDIIDILKKRNDQCSVAIDEELPFTFLNGYIAYRSGYRCFMITSEDEMGRVLGNENQKITLSLEDLDIKFSGMKYNTSRELRNFDKRDDKFVVLKKIGSPDFYMHEFKPPFTIEKLCSAICYEYDLSLKSANNSIEWLNELLKLHNLYDIIMGSEPNKSFSKETMILIGKIKECRNRSSSNLCDEESNIKRLNRLILEEIFPKETPKNRRRRLIITGVATNEERKICKEIMYKIIDKPYAGVYDLQNNINENETKDSVSENYLGFWEQFKSHRYERCESQSNVVNNNKKEPIKSHSASSRLLIIANSLIDRTRKIPKVTKSCEMAVQGAILALEAKEILHGNSITTALEAVSLQHQMEVQAECSFYGVAHEIKTVERFKEISREVDNIIRMSDAIESNPNLKPNKLAQSYNAQVGIVNNVLLIFKEHEQFDEEDKCLIYVRRLRQGLHLHTILDLPKRSLNRQFKNSILIKRCTNSFAAISLDLPEIKLNLKLLKVMLLDSYFNWLITSIINIIYSMMIWIGLFTVFYSLLDVSNFWKSTNNFLRPLGQSFLTFFEMQPANIMKEYEYGVGFYCILIVELIVAYVHLGIFITYLYQKLSRR